MLTFGPLPGTIEYLFPRTGWRITIIHICHMSIYIHICMSVHIILIIHICQVSIYICMSIYVLLLYICQMSISICMSECVVSLYIYVICRYIYMYVLALLSLSFGVWYPTETRVAWGYVTHPFLFSAVEDSVVEGQ